MGAYSSCRALVIGVGRYADPQHDLSYARSDAEAMAELLGNEFGFEQVWTLYDDDATKENIRRFLEQDLQQTDEDDGVVIFFAGHGITVPSAIGDDHGFLVPHDGNPKERYANISLASIRDDYLPNIPAKHVLLIVDACYGGLALRDIATVERPKNIDDAVLSELTRRDRKVRQVLAAGTKDQRVLDGGLFGHSIFTGRLIEALREANPYITADHVGVHVRERVARDSLDRKHRQTPQFGYLFGGDGSFVFARCPHVAVASQPDQHSLILADGPTFSETDEPETTSSEDIESDSASLTSYPLSVLPQYRIERVPQSDPDSRKIPERTDVESLPYYHGTTTHVKQVSPSMDLATRNYTQTFVSKHAGQWNHTQWIEFLHSIRVSYPECTLSDAAIMESLEGTKREYLRRRREQWAGLRNKTVQTSVSGAPSALSWLGSVPWWVWAIGVLVAGVTLGLYASYHANGPNGYLICAGVIATLIGIIITFVVMAITDEDSTADSEESGSGYPIIALVISAVLFGGLSAAGWGLGVFDGSWQSRASQQVSSDMSKLVDVLRERNIKMLVVQTEATYSGFKAKEPLVSFLRESIPQQIEVRHHEGSKADIDANAAILDCNTEPSGLFDSTPKVVHMTLEQGGGIIWKSSWEWPDFVECRDK